MGRAIASAFAFLVALAGLVQGYYAVIDHWPPAPNRADRVAGVSSTVAEVERQPVAAEHPSAGTPVRAEAPSVPTVTPTPDTSARSLVPPAVPGIVPVATPLHELPTAKPCLNERQEAVGDGPLRVALARCARIALASDRARYGTRVSGWITNASEGAVSVTTVSDYYHSSLGWEHHVGSWSGVTSAGNECLVKNFGNVGLPTVAVGIFRREQVNAQRLNDGPALTLEPGQTAKFSVMFYCTDAKGGDTLDGSIRLYSAAAGENWRTRAIAFEAVGILPQVD